MKYHRSIINTILTTLMALSLCSCTAMEIFDGLKEYSEEKEATNETAEYKLYRGLYSYFGHGNWALLEEAVEEGANLNQFTNGRYGGEGFKTPILIALERFYVKETLYLLEQGADPNVMENGITPLMRIITSQRYYYPVFESLLDHGADITLRNRDGKTVWDLLFEYIEDPSLTAAKIRRLIQANPSFVEAKDLCNILDEASLPVSLAQEMLALLREHGKDTGLSELETAAMNGDGGKVREIFPNVPLDDRRRALRAMAAYCDTQDILALKPEGEELDFLLYNAAQCGNTELVQSLLDAGASADYTRDGLCPTPLLTALDNGHRDAAELLMNHITYFHAGYFIHENELDCAASKGDVEAIRLLDKYSYDPDIEEVNKAMNVAAEYGQLDVLQYFLDTGWPADTDSDTQVMNPIFTASHRGNLDAVKLLVEGGATVANPEDNNGSVAMQTALENGYPEIVIYLHEHGANIHGYMNITNYGSPLNDAIMYGQYEIVEYLLDNGVDINADYSTILKASGGSTRILKLLLDRGISLNSISKDDGASSLLNAVKNGTYQNVELLLEAGADPTATDAEGNDILYLAKKYKRGPEIYEVFQKYGIE